MGSVKKYLCKVNLPDREMHNSRLFIDLAENIHIHYREYRLVFSLNEFFEFSDILQKSTIDVRNFLIQNPDYEEQKYPTTLMIAGGRKQQLKFLTNSKKPNCSCYFNNIFDIELQDEFVTDEIHIHYRDFRIAMNRKNFKIVAEGFNEANKNLKIFENNNTYIRETHSDRAIKSFNTQNRFTDKFNFLQGSQKVSVNKIKSFWYKDFYNEFKPKKNIINIIKKELSENNFFPILISTEKDGSNLIIDGHHRYYTVLRCGLDEVDAIICDLTFAETEELRKAEGLLKVFDLKTNYKYNMSSFFKEYMSFKSNRYYKGTFYKLLKKNTAFYRILRNIKRLILGKQHLFKNFNEAFSKKK